MAAEVVFIDTEISTDGKKILDIGALRGKSYIHSPDIRVLKSFAAGAPFLCGHNIIHHDLKYLSAHDGDFSHFAAIDTLYLSPLFFPKRPYHALVKDDKLQTDELNNPVNDCQKAQELFFDEVNAFNALPRETKRIYYALLSDKPEFKAFFKYMGATRPLFFNTVSLIKSAFKNKICANAPLDTLIKNYPTELSYALAVVSSNDYGSITPPWILKNYPAVEYVIKQLRGQRCAQNCPFCKETHDIHRALKQIFGYPSFRTYNGEPLQERAAQAAVDGKSLLAVFPTGGGKSITFQLPALMAGSAVHGLTVVISPLQSLMKDQVDNLSELGITGAVTVNGMMSPVERADSLARVADGSASLLYISPEQLRSRTIEKLLVSRNIVRFVIDEAHCFSAWGHDFRVDYLYIGDFIRELQTQKRSAAPIPVSCFTATAKQKVITDICEYFKLKLDLNLEIFATEATRENLRYFVLYKESDEEKYAALRDLIARKKCPTIVYVTRTKRAVDLAQRLTNDGFPARPYHGKMDSAEKIANQEDFIANRVGIIVATSAFGMGVDKKDVRLVIHYDISDSLENYVQEAGRAGRDPSIQAECFVLFNDNDLDKHFILLNQTKLSISEIQQVWKAIKDMTKARPYLTCSALEIARQAGWDDSVSDIETRVKTAVAALENAGYIKRGRNVPHVYATSILVKNMAEASFRIDKSPLFTDSQRVDAKRIIKSLISERSAARAGNDDAESRIDYLADMLGIAKENVIDCVNLMRQEGLLADSLDMSAYILKSDTQNKSMQILERFARLERFVIKRISMSEGFIDLKKLNEAAVDEGITDSSVKDIRTILYFLTVKGIIRKSENKENGTFESVLTDDYSKTLTKLEHRIEICGFILDEMFQNAEKITDSAKEEAPVLFSLVRLFNSYKALPRINKNGTVTLHDIEDALLYLSKIGSLKLEGGFLVLYNAIEIRRLVTDNKIRYKLEDYKTLGEFYKQKIQQIHIVGEYANLMVKNYAAALQFVQDYFGLDFKQFIAKYFKGERSKEIGRNITPAKYHALFDGLSKKQLEIISDAESRCIVVAAGPGSGKTRVLVHKLASLLMLEDVKHEQLLMVTFSRAAATEFKKRLISLIGNAANFVEIKTFHSYCFDLLGKTGSLDNVDNVVKDAARMIAAGEVEPGKIMKSVLVIDEAQDMDADEYALVCALMSNNEEMRVIAVGDDDQNIYEFRGSDSKYMRAFITEHGAVRYDMTENYRSCTAVTALANAFAQKIRCRLKSEPIRAVSTETGTVCITNYKSPHFEQALIDNIIASHTGGSACVLTVTNNEAFQILGMLLKNGIRAKLIQSLNGFRLYNLMEIRYFLKHIDKELQSPVIPDKLWRAAQTAVSKKFEGSACLEICRNLWSDFESTFRTKYRSDLEEFIRESNYEDFYGDEKGTVFVSTIHKAKGREFDTVYMLLKNCAAVTDEEKRRIYVGLTRAKSRLYIHCGTPLFSGITLPDITVNADNTDYPPPREISMQLTHRDVVLDYFKYKKELIFKLRSDEALSFECLTETDFYLNAELDGRTVRIAKLSSACVAALQKLFADNFYVCGAEVNFIVAWKGENDETETPVLLADLHLKLREE